MSPAPTRFPVAGDIVALTLREEKLHVLLIERKYEPYQGSLAFPGGFVEPDEQLVNAALRELAEETGVTRRPELIVQLGAYGVGGRDPRGDTVGVVFIAVSPDFGEVVAGDDAAVAEWHSLDEVITARGLAFDHYRILGDALQRMLREMVTHPTGSEGLPSDFVKTFRTELMRCTSL